MNRSLAIDDARTLKPLSNSLAKKSDCVQSTTLCIFHRRSLTKTVRSLYFPDSSSVAVPIYSMLPRTLAFGLPPSVGSFAIYAQYVVSCEV